MAANDWEQLEVAVNTRLAALIPARPGAEAGVAFALPTEALPPAEQNALALLAEADQVGWGPAAPEAAASFAVPGGLSGFEAAKAQFLDETGRLLQQLGNLVSVETPSQPNGSAGARSVVSWGGDLATWLAVDLPAEAAAQHTQDLAAALQRRQAQIRLLLLTLQSAAKLALLLSSPGGQLLALPVAWQYIRQVSTELKLAI
jgi:hypothetical protein